MNIRRAIPAIFLACWPVAVLVSQVPGKPLIDQRDGRGYETVQIGEQLWMAENLDFGGVEKWCYNHDPAMCGVYGGLYTWEAAIEACPAGWHLPAKEEWEALSRFLGVEKAGQQMKAAGSDPVPWDGSNSSGFSAIPAGSGNGEGFHRQGDWALFWSSSEAGEQRAWFAQLDGYWYPAPPKYRNLFVGNYYLKTNQFSVRCIKDGEQ